MVGATHLCYLHFINGDTAIMKLICVSAARGIQIQCDEEFGVDNEGEDARATDLLKLNQLESKDLDPNNLDC